MSDYDEFGEAIQTLIAGLKAQDPTLEDDPDRLVETARSMMETLYRVPDPYDDEAVWFRTRAVQTIRAWIEDQYRLTRADSSDEKGRYDSVWHFRSGQSGRLLFEYRGGNNHPARGHAQYMPLGRTPAEALPALNALGISPDMLVQPHK